MTSAWLHTATVWEGWASRSRSIASTDLACISNSDSPSGNRAADGVACTTFQSGSLPSSLSVRPVQSP
jgi:hypothetical protein